MHLLQLKEVDAKHLDGPHHQVVHLLVLSEERLLVPLLVLHKGLNVLVEAVAGRALRGLGGELALLKEEGEEGEEGVLVDLPLVGLKLGLVKVIAMLVMMVRVTMMVTVMITRECF